MLYKISLKNIRKSYKDYTIYFLTLILGVSIFYIFNSLDSQEAMLIMSNDKRDIIKLMVSMLSAVSIGVSVILGFLIIYANGFLIKRRKKEFGIYLSLGMSKRDVSTILIGETILIGLLSLAIGLLIGIFASQLMSILIAKMFEADLQRYRFIFSKGAMIKTIIFFGLMFLLVIMFNAVAVGRYKLVELLSASRKNEQIKLKNPALAVVTFLVSVIVLSYCYYSITKGYADLDEVKVIMIIGLGSVSTFLFFWSLSGFFLVLVQRNRNFYLRGLNAFMFRQLHNKINTMVFAMTIICLMLFVSIGAIATGMTLRDSANRDIREASPADFSIRMKMSGKDSKLPEEILKESGFDMRHLQAGYVTIPVYTYEELTMKELLGEKQVEEISKTFTVADFGEKTQIYSVTDYNKLAKLYGREEFSLEEDEYIELNNLEVFQPYVDRGLKDSDGLMIDGKNYHSKYETAQKGMVDVGMNRMLNNAVLLPEQAFKDKKAFSTYNYVMAAHYSADSDKECNRIEEELMGLNLESKYKEISWLRTKIQITDSNVGLSAIVTFLGIYIGVIFLITSAAMLALKELSEAADNKERYQLLKKLGAEDAMISRTLCTQIGIFFMVPLILAIVHAIFGISFVNKMLIAITGQHILKPILVSVGVYSVIYIIYFISTCLGSKRIVEE